MKISNIIQEQNQEQLDELNWKDIQRGAKKVSKGANKFTKNVADTGAVVGQAAKDVGNAAFQTGKTLVADPVAATYNASKAGLNRAANVAKNTYGDVKAGATKVGNAIDTVQTDTGNAAKSLGRNAAKAVGGAAGAVGATVGGATTGLGRAAAHGFNTGVQNVGGDAVDKMQTNIMKPSTDPEVIKQQIAQKQGEIKDLESQLSQATPQAASGNATLGSVAKGFAQGMGADKLATSIDADNKTATPGASVIPNTNFGLRNIPQPAAPAPAPNFSRGQQSFAPSSVSYSSPQKTAVAPVAASSDRPTQQPITIGGQKIMPNDPRYAEIMKNAPAMAESIDLSEVLWRKMKSKS